MSWRSGPGRWGSEATRINPAATAGFALAVACAMTSMSAVPARAQAPDEAWRTLETDHFRVTFPESLESLGRRAADRAERAYAELEEHFIEAPDGRIDLLLTDHADISNGFASVRPSNRITIFARPPVDALALGFSDEWLELVITHELVHVIHLDHVVNPVGRLARAVFGRVPSEWPFFPELGTPGWVIEGIATWYESRLTEAGRTRGSYHDMQLRTAALQDRFESIGQAGAESPVWPTGNRPYLYGSLFFDFLMERHGEDKMAAFVDAVGGQWIPYRLDAAGRSAFGTSLTEEWEAWKASVKSELEQLDAELERLGPVTEPEAVTDGARWALYPEVSPDGRWLAYARSDGHSDIELSLVDLESGASRSLGRTNRLATFSWIDPQRILVSQVEFVDPYRYYMDLYLFDLEGGQRRLTHRARLAQPDVAVGGAWGVAVREGGGTNEIVTFRLSGASGDGSGLVGSAEGPDVGAVETLVDARPDVHWAFPRISPDGRWIAASRFEPGARHDLVIVDARSGEVVERVTEDRALDLAPRWSPDGRWIVWTSDRTGTFNVHAASVGSEGSAGPPRLLTNVRTGVAYPALDPEGGWLYLSGYHADGWEIERVPFGTDVDRPAPPLADRFVTDAPPPPPPRVEGEVRPYSAGPTLRPYYWEVSYEDAVVAPGVRVDGGGGSTVELPGRELLGPALGIQTDGRDLVGRHAYNLFLRATTRGPTRLDGGFSYAWAGLGNPVLGMSASQRYTARGQILATRETDATQDTLYVLGRDRFLQGSMTFRAPTWRWGRSVTLAGGLVWDHRELLGGDLEPTDEFRLTRPDARLADGSISFSLNSTRSHPFQLGTSEGLALFVQGRVRRHLSLPDSLRSFAGVDRSTREVIGSVRGAVPLFRAGYARHVIAFRASGGIAAGAGADPGFYRVGGTTGQPEPVTGLELFGGSFFFFPVRGYDPGSRFGRYAWTGSAEYRIPLWMIHRGLRAWPIHFDRTMASVFFDVGNAWGPDFWPGTGFVNPVRTAIASTGAELTAELLTFYDITLRLRGGVAFPLVAAGGTSAGEPSFYVRVGLPY